MGTVIEIFMMGCFCLIAGYLLGFVQRMEATLARMDKHLEAMATQTAQFVPISAPPDTVAPLAGGLYIPGEQMQNGLTPLVPLQNNSRS